MSNGFDTDPFLGPNCLQRLFISTASTERVKIGLSLQKSSKNLVKRLNKDNKCVAMLLTLLKISFFFTKESCQI